TDTHVARRIDAFRPTLRDLGLTEAAARMCNMNDQFRPHIAVITNLMPTHIDYHGSFEEYVNAKWNIQNNMSDKDFLILNGDQEISYDLANKTKATILYFSSQKEVDGAYCLDGKLYFEGEYIMDADQIGVPGLHNVENALATIAVAKLANVDNDSIKETLASFGGVKHRLQYVGQVNQIKFYNDSKSTNILACQKALSSFDNSNLILIAGGLDRGNEFDDLVPDIIGLKKLILLGQSADKMKKAAEKAGVSYLDAKDVAEATAIAFKEAKQGDVVLLSPANASWDMYKSFETRGDEFIQAFEQIKGDA
ncbi:MAG: UDP-N-acetylmuramoyl-L-alanine--D-glutamate ligase, partial [Streptococcus parauberis]